MSLIVPTINTGDPNRYKMMIDTYSRFARRVQIDVNDGIFAESPTVPVQNLWWPRAWSVDVHMMVEKPSEHMTSLLKLRPAMVILHAEAKEDLLPVIATLKKYSIRIGVGLLKSTFPGSVKQYIDVADHVLIFSGSAEELGGNGTKADMLQLEKAALVKNIKPSIELGWDGGANIDNVRVITQYGFDIINVGNAIATSSQPSQEYARLQHEANEEELRISLN